VITRGNKIVFFPMDNPATDRTGQLVRVKVEEAGPWSMQGSLIRVVQDTPSSLRALLDSRNKRFTIPLTPVAQGQ